MVRESQVKLFLELASFFGLVTALGIYDFRSKRQGAGLISPEALEKYWRFRGDDEQRKGSKGAYFSQAWRFDANDNLGHFAAGGSPYLVPLCEALLPNYSALLVVSHGTWSGLMKTVYFDGTFKIAPGLFAHVYVLLAEREGFVFPVLYALLPNKLEGMYG
uniref:Uncharacterized protein n=1 Tax=Trichuris muris TaxID=70415 RepID=A0A5S6QNV2_TRIMR